MTESEVDDIEVQVDHAVVCVASTEQLNANDERDSFHKLEARKRTRLFNFLNGPFKQHQFFLHCVDELTKYNAIDTEVKGRILPVAPNPTIIAGNVFCLLLWFICIVLPVVFIIVGYVEYDTWRVCCSAMLLCLLISGYSIAIFFILHNQKIAKRLWFVTKVSLDHYYGRENSIVEVTLDNTMTMQFLSASQKSQVITRLARSKDKKGMMMICTKSLWVSRIQDPLLCLLFLIIISLVALVVDLDLVRRNHL
ncbi:uncharacterized protein [Littorina saxatilis]|uniref:Transmembrane protein n=1 Tax=Littorina saxatilis TaxID=31220 RepID=A0AAN9B708_9CAEN